MRLKEECSWILLHLQIIILSRIQNCIERKENINMTRSGNVDLAKFFASLIIMMQHASLVLSVRPYNDCWIYVEFFLIITGFYTAKHFDNRKFDNRMKESIAYTLRKFIPFYPYTLVTTIFMYLLTLVPELILGDINIKGFLFGFVDDFPFDALLITASYGNPLVRPLWYLSAMIIVFPLVAWFVQISNRYIILYYSFFYMLIYYGIKGVTAERSTISTFFRIIAGLCVGVFVYEIIYIFGNSIKRINKILLTSIEVGAFIFPIVIIYNKFDSTRFILLCFIVGCSIMLSGVSYTNSIKGEAITYLGRLSMPIYIHHWLVGNLIRYCLTENIISAPIKLLLYYGSTIVISMITMYLIDHWKWFQNLIKCEWKFL